MRLVALFLILSAFAAQAQSSADLKQVETEMAKLLVKGDFDAYASRLTDDYLRINMNGTKQNKQEALNYLRSGASKILDLEPAEMNVRTYGDAAVVNGDLTAVQRVNGKVVTTTARFTETFVQKDGQWLLTTTHYTTAPK